MSIKVRIAESYEDMKATGDYRWYEYEGKREGINIVCLCGALIGTNSGWQVLSEDPLTIAPSLLHIGEGCHFFIRNGEIEVV